SVEFRFGLTRESAHIGPIEGQPRQAGIDDHADVQFQVIPCGMIIACPERGEALRACMGRADDIEWTLPWHGLFQPIARGAGHQRTIEIVDFQVRRALPFKIVAVLIRHFLFMESVEYDGVFYFVSDFGNFPLCQSPDKSGPPPPRLWAV